MNGAGGFGFRFAHDSRALARAGSRARRVRRTNVLSHVFIVCAVLVNSPASHGFQVRQSPGGRNAGTAASVKLRIPTRTLEVGEAVDGQLVCTNTESPEVPSISAPPGLAVTLTNPSPSVSQQIISSFGRTTRSTEYSFPLRIVALKEGAYQVGPITVRAGGRVYQTEPVTVIVRKTERGQANCGDKLIFVEMRVEPRSVFVTQTFTAELRIGIRKVRVSGRAYDLNLFRDVLVQRDSEFSLFPGGASVRRGMWLTDANGQRHEYELLSITKEIRAEEVGSMRVGPIFVKANYPTSLRRGWFGRYEISAATKETDRTEAVRVEVKEPPLADRPADYTGAIGRYRMATFAKPTELEQGRPVTLTITIRGTPIEGVAGPDLAQHPELSSRFDFTKEELVGEVTRGAKIFRRAIFPKQAGEQTVPPITWSYFDPGAETYNTLTSDPIPIRVDPSSSQPLGIDGQATDTGLPKPTTLTLLSGGISPNHVDPDAILADQSFSLTGGSVSLLIAGPLAWLVVTLVSNRRARLRSDAGLARRRRARRTAKVRIARALKDGDAQCQLQGLALALTDYLADRLDLPPARATPTEVRDVLSLHGTDETIVREIVEFLDACDAARYAPPGENSSVPQLAADRIKGWIAAIERNRG